MCLELSKQGEQELRAGRDGAGPAGGVCGRWGRIGLLPPGRWERGGLWAEEGREAGAHRRPLAAVWGTVGVLQ